ncbi:type II toxin-antitoxin system TacA family antitoxin [Myxosarcina sp. GI1(2024)]
MTTKSNSKATARLEARVTPEIKALIQNAADIQGRTITDFVVATVVAEARRAIEQHQTLKLNLEDSETFVNTILNPPQPNDSLQSAARRYKQVMSD